MTVDGLAPCYDSAGNVLEHCMAVCAGCYCSCGAQLIALASQVAYSSNVFIIQCGGEYVNNSDCGTFLELHRGSGTFYFGACKTAFVSTFGTDDW